MRDERYQVADHVYISRDYDMFKCVVGNRDVTKQRARKVIHSIDNVGYIVPAPIVVNEKFEVIDGQGRIEALKEKGLPVYFVISKGAGLKECISMNLGQENWKTIDYIKSYASKGNQNYVRLLNLMDKYPWFSIAEIMGICANAITANGFGSLTVKNEELELSEETVMYAIPRLEYLNEMRECIDAIPGSSRVKKTAIAWIISNTSCDKKRLKNLLLKEWPVLSPVVDKMPILFLSELSDLYNKRMSKDKCLYFDAMYKQSRK